MHNFTGLLCAMHQFFKERYTKISRFDFGVTRKCWRQDTLIDCRRKSHWIWCVVCVKRNFSLSTQNIVIRKYNVLPSGSGCVPRQIVRLISGIRSAAPFSSRTISFISCSFGDTLLLGARADNACKNSRRNFSRPIIPCKP